MPGNAPSPTGGVAIHVVEHHERVPGTGRAATVLVDFIDSDRFADFFKSVPIGEVVTAHRIEGTDAVSQAAAVVRKLRFRSVNAVLWLAGRGDLNFPLVQHTVDAVRTFGGGIVVIVDSDCRRWEALLGVSGFVDSTAPTPWFAAGAVLRMLAGLREPESVIGPTAEDFLHRLGTALNPAVVIEAVCVGTPLVLQLSESDRRIVRAASDVNAFVSASNIRMPGPVHVTSALRAATDPECVFTFQASTKPLLASYFDTRIALVEMLCSL